MGTLGLILANLPQLLTVMRLFLELLSRVPREQRKEFLARAVTGFQKLKEAKTDDQVFDALGDIQHSWRGVGMRNAK